MRQERFESLHKFQESDQAKALACASTLPGNGSADV
jgi:hypothetical protein